MRMDKWLWAARFFKTRALAARACELGRVQIADQPAAPGLELPQRHGARSQGQNREIRNGGSLPGSDSWEGARSKRREAAAGDGEGAYTDVRDRAGSGENEAQRRLSPRPTPSKPAREVRIGDHLRITTDSGVFAVDVKALSEIRGPASAAQKLYQESDDSRAARAREAEIRRLNWQASADTPGRPTKRDRRHIARLRGH